MNGCCNCYFVVEGDGSVYPCDFYCMDEWKLGTVNDGFVQMKTSEKAKAFVEASRPVCATCHECPYFSLCRGGCFLRIRQNAWKGWAHISGRNMWEVENRKILDINTY